MIVQLRTKESIRPLVTDCLRAVSGRLRNPEAVEALAASLMEILEGKAEGGKVKAPAERVALIGALGALGDAPPLEKLLGSCQPSEGVAEKLPGKFVAFMTAFYKEEREYNDFYACATRPCSFPATFNASI